MKKLMMHMKVSSISLILVFLILSTSIVNASQYTKYDELLPTKINNKYSNIAKGKNIILLEVEGFQNIFINEKYNEVEIMPNINKLIKSKGSIYFSQFYNNSNVNDMRTLYNTITSNYNFSYGNSFDRIGDNAMTLPRIFKANGYQSMIIESGRLQTDQDRLIYKKIGFNRYLSDDIVDSYALAFDRIRESTNSPNFIYAKFHLKSGIKDDIIGLDSLDSKTALGVNLKSIAQFDRDLGRFIDKLNANKNIIIIYGSRGLDYRDPNVLNSVSTYKEAYNILDMINMPLIILNLNDENRLDVNMPASNVDIMPTILNITGLKDQAELTVGSDLLSLKNDNRVLFEGVLKKGSYLDKDHFVMTDDYGKNILAYDRNLNPIDSTQFKNEIEANIKKIDLSNGLMELDIARQIKNANKNKKIMQIDNSKSIMHAGGELSGMTYTNMLEALDENYKRGKRYFEIDFEFTTDNKPVAIHSWDGFLSKFFGVTPKDCPFESEECTISYSYDEFMAFDELHGYTQMDLNILLKWIKTHKDAYIITDAKSNNISLANMIKNTAPELMDRIIIQIYNRSEYPEIKNLGFDKIIYTLYRSTDSEDTVLNFAKNNKLYGVTVEHKRFKLGFGNRLLKEGIDLFIHTVNDIDEANRLIQLGVKGVYTDVL
ncbi:MAG: sulfatase-like hydrolase/transferase [Ezakiella sp.]|nr:sulfatase-like hydrolase/transferase [Ezakiella sp.]